MMKQDRCRFSGKSWKKSKVLQKKIAKKYTGEKGLVILFDLENEKNLQYTKKMENYCIMGICEKKLKKFKKSS